MALALCKELRQDFGLPAYILRSKEFPMKSYIRGTPVQAPSETTRSAIKQPEQVRIHDEAAVLVGNEKTLQGSEILLHKVKKLHPKCLDGMPRSWIWREGPSHALPNDESLCAGAMALSQGAGPPGRPDELGPAEHRQLPRPLHAPGRAVLQAARSYDLKGPGDHDGPEPIFNPRTSPLQTAHDDAERLADKLSRVPEIKHLGQPVFVYHDRTSSRVFVGSFNSPKDPAIWPRARASFSGPPAS